MLKLGSCVLMETLRYSLDANQMSNLGCGLWGGFKPKSTPPHSLPPEALC